MAQARIPVQEPKREAAYSKKGIIKSMFDGLKKIFLSFLSQALTRLSPKKTRNESEAAQNQPAEANNKTADENKSDAPTEDYIPGSGSQRDAAFTTGKVSNVLGFSPTVSRAQLKITAMYAATEAANQEFYQSLTNEQKEKILSAPEPISEQKKPEKQKPKEQKLEDQQEQKVEVERPKHSFRFHSEGPKLKEKNPWLGFGSIASYLKIRY